MFKNTNYSPDIAMVQDSIRRRMTAEALGPCAGERKGLPGSAWVYNSNFDAAAAILSESAKSSSCFHLKCDTGASAMIDMLATELATLQPGQAVKWQNHRATPGNLLHGENLKELIFPFL